MQLEAPQASARQLLAFASVLGLALLPVACSGGGGSSGNPFKVRSTDQAVDGTTALEVVGKWLVYFADETFSGPVDLNLDGDTLDDVAVAVNLVNGKETNLRAARSAQIVGSEVYLEVDEATDGQDWDGDLMLDDDVILHWSSKAGVVTFVDLLSNETANVALMAAGGRLYYTSETTSVGDETALRYLDPAAPTTPVTVMNTVGGGTREPILLGEDDGLLFLFLKESQEALDLNGDADQSDDFVLALLDATADDSQLVTVGLALEDEDAPFAAYPVKSHDWLVGFLVDEADQGGTNLNAQTLFTQPLLPDSCAGTPDTDTNDQVLHYLRFDDFVTAMPDALINTGLAGRDRVLAIDDYVATLSPEADANCDLNEDTDMSDDMPRWVRANATFNTGTMQYTVAPPRDPSQLHAAKTSLPGGSMGLTSLGQRFVAVIAEDEDSRNLDGKAADHDLVGWLDPSNGFTTTWDFTHQRSANPGHGTGVFDSLGNSEPYAGASWMAAEEEVGRLGIAFMEEVPGTNPNISSLNTNLNCSFLQKDMDLTDSLPTWCDFEKGPTLDFDGVGFAVVEDNAGIVITGNQVFFRVSEADDNIDYSGDGDKTDTILMRNPRTTCNPRAMSVSTTLAGPVVETDGVRGAAFFASEFQGDEDFNGDGDKNDVVVRFFTIL